MTVRSAERGGWPSARHRWAGVLVIAYLGSRAVLWWLGARVDASMLDRGWQFLPPETLEHHLGRGLWALHSQPPLLNLVVGSAIKASPRHWALVVAGVWLVEGVVAQLCFYCLLVRHGVAVALAAVISIVALLSPSAMLYEQDLLYTHSVYCLLLIAALLLDCYVASWRPAVGALFFTTLAAVCLTRASYHLVWLVGCLVALIALHPRRARQIACCALLPLVIVSAWYAKNAALVGHFTASTWLGLSLGKLWTWRPLPADELRALVADRRISPISAVRAYSSLPSYAPHLPPFPATGIPELDDTVAPSGHPNFNHRAYAWIASQYQRDAPTIGAHFPGHVAWAIARSWRAYFLPTSDYLRAILEEPGAYRYLRHLARAYELTLCGATGDGPLRLCWTAPLVFAGCVAVLVWPPLRRRVTDRDPGLKPLLLFCAGTVVYVALVSNAVEMAENMRYRHETSGLALAAVVLAGERVRRTWRCPQRASSVSGPT